MSRSCLYCEHARVTPPALPLVCEPGIECMARNDLYVVHPILRALTCSGFKDKHRLQLEEREDKR